jgi:DNA-binding NtrC family response regulator
MADDEPVVLELGESILSRLGFRVLTAHDGQHAVELFKERKDEVDLVLLDMTMPKLNGAEAFAQMNKIKPGVPTILSSGYNEQDATSHFMGEDLAGFLQKPWGAQQLEDAVLSVLGTGE